MCVCDVRPGIRCLVPKKLSVDYRMRSRGQIAVTVMDLMEVLPESGDDAGISRLVATAASATVKSQQNVTSPPMSMSMSVSTYIYIAHKRKTYTVNHKKT